MAFWVWSGPNQRSFLFFGGSSVFMLLYFSRAQKSKTNWDGRPRQKWSGEGMIKTFSGSMSWIIAQLKKISQFIFSRFPNFSPNRRPSYFNFFSCRYKKLIRKLKKQSSLYFFPGWLQKGGSTSPSNECNLSTIKK